MSGDLYRNQADLTDHTAEVEVLACCWNSDVARRRAREILDGADFWKPAHEDVWDVMLRLDKQGMPFSPSTFLAAMSPQHRDFGHGFLSTLVTYPVMPSDVATFAERVRVLAQKRRMLDELARAQQMVLQPDSDIGGLAAGITNRLAQVRDSGISETLESLTVEELMLEVDDEPDWVVPGLFERSDRLILTGVEGLGKSHTLRQIAILSAAGLHPFRPHVRIEPVKSMVIDFENTKRQIRRRLWPIYNYALTHGHGHPGLAPILALPRSDITTDKVISRIHRELDARQPDLLVIGPIYKMHPKALQSDDDATPVLAALDSIRDRGIVLLIEAHAGHTLTHGKQRDMRPRGSSQQLGWPEFGYGMKAAGDGLAALVPWRGDREAREFPGLLRATPEGLWVADRPQTVREIWRTRTEDWSDLEEE